MAQTTRTSLTFGYGSNMWKSQMASRCPKSPFVGIARLDGWKWIISERHYANVIKSPGDSVYGLVYDLTELDEARLDRREGVPNSYTKEYLSVSFLGTKELPEKLEIKVLVYVDYKRIKEGRPEREYICRMVSAFADALSEGVPEDYVVACLPSLKLQ